MWLRRSAFLALLVLTALVALPSAGGTITRGGKASGGTAFVDGWVIDPDEVNYDFDTVYTLVNGNLDANNLAAGSVGTSEIINGTITNDDVNNSAAIDTSKLDDADEGGVDAYAINDYSNDDAEQMTESSPGTSDSLTNGTNLEDELEQLRYKIHELTVGATASAVASGSGTASDTSWADGPIRGPNLIYNGGFDVWTSSTPDVGDGWAATASAADTVQSEALVEAEGHGDGNGINVIAGAGDTNEGVKQTLDGLKADTRYLAIVETRDDVGTCNLSTTGADTNQLSVTSDDTGNWQVLAGVFETDSTPTDVVISLVAVGNSNDCVFEDAAVFEINADPVQVSGPVAVYNTYTANDAVDNSFTDVAGLSTVDFSVPGPGWIVQVGYAVSAGEANNQYQICCRLEEDGVDLTGTESCQGQADDNDPTAVESSTVNSTYLAINPTPGDDLTYTVECNDENSGMTYNFGGTESNLWLLAFPPR